MIREKHLVLMATRWLFGSLLLSIAAARAQAPVATPAGDPSVRDDTIYALAVDPRAYADQPFVYLLDDGVERYEKDGSGWRTYRQVIQLLTPESVRKWGELVLPYQAGRERITLNWVRVVDSAGRIVNTKQPFEVQPGGSASSSASSSAERRLSLSGLEVGKILDYSFTVRMLPASFAARYVTSWRVAPGEQVQRSRFLVDLWLDADPRIVERHLTFRGKDDIIGNRRVYVWATKDVRKVDHELFAPDSSYLQEVWVASPLTWIDISKAFARYLDRTDLLRFALQSQATEALRGATSGEDTLRRLYAWSAGAPYCHPDADTSFRSTPGVPICAHRGVILVAAARWLGYQAFPVLVGPVGAVDREIPSASGFQRIIAAVELDEDRYLFFDPVAKDIPYGEVPRYEEGQFGLLVRDDGEYTKVELPVPPPAANRVEFVVAGAVDARGGFSGRITLRATGRTRDRLRALASRGALTDSLRAASCRSTLFDSLFAHIDTLAAGEEKDTSAPLTVSVPVCGGMVSGEGKHLLLELPLADLSGKTEFALAAAVGSRAMPIDAQQVTGNFEMDQRLELTLPAGWKAKLPHGVKASSSFGSYEATYTQLASRLTIERKLTGATGVYPASAWPDLLAWLRARSTDDAKLVVIDAF